MKIGQKIYTIYGWITLTEKRYSPLKNAVIWYGRTQDGVEYEITTDVIRDEPKDATPDPSFKNLAKALGIKKGDKGEKGDTPKVGIDYYSKQQIERIIYQLIRQVTPQKGKDYFTKQEIDEFIKKSTPVSGIDFKDGKDGKDGKTPVYGKDYFTKKQTKDFIAIIYDQLHSRIKDGKDGEDGKDAKFEYKWEGTRLFIKRDGEWDDGVELRGMDGIGGGGGIHKIDDATDVSIFNPSIDQVLTYNPTTKKWTNADQSGSGSSLTIQEEDGSPTGTPTTLKVTNGALIDNGDGSFSLDTGGGSGSMTTVKEGGVQLGGSDIVTLDYDGDDFNLTESPDTEVNITINDAGVDHDSTTNFVANEHIDHTSVTLTAGDGLSGGGTIAANRTFDVDITNASDKAAPVVGDELLLADSAAAGAIKKSDIAAIANLADHDSLTNFDANEHFTQANITTVGTITTGTWNGTDIAVADGGTGASDAATARTNLGAGTMDDVVDDTTPQLGGNLDVNAKNIQYTETAGGADHTASGDIADMTVGENVNFGDFLYMKSDGKLWKSDANASGTMPIIAMAIATISADASGEVLLRGFARDDTWTWTVGGRVYASGTAGGATQTAPSATGDRVQVVGIATHADRLYFSPSLAEVEVA